MKLDRRGGDTAVMGGGGKGDVPKPPHASGEVPRPWPFGAAVAPQASIEENVADHTADHVASVIRDH